MCRQCSMVVAAFVRMKLAGDGTANIRDLVRELKPRLPEMGEDELLNLVDAAVIGNWCCCAEGRPGAGDFPAH